MSPLLSLALLPAAALLFYIYRMDTVEKEPFKLLLRLFLFGCLCAIPASILEGIGGALIANVGNLFVQMFLEAFLIVAVAEEGCKFAFLCTSWKNPAFDYRFDAIVYAVFVSLGFAALENVLYVIQNGFATAIMRAVTSVPGHCFFGVMMGYWFGKAKYASHNRLPNSKLYLALSFVVPVLLHGFYDFCCFMSGDYGVFLLIFFAFLIPFFILSILLVKKASRADAPIDPNRSAEGDGFDPMQPYRSAGFTPGQPYVPGQRPYVPGQQPYVPGQQPYVPGQRPYVPGQSQGNPYAGLSPDAPDAERPGGTDPFSV